MRSRLTQNRVNLSPQGNPIMPARTLRELPPTAWPKNTGYVIDLEPLPFRVRAEGRLTRAGSGQRRIT